MTEIATDRPPAEVATERARRLAGEPMREAGPRLGFASGTLASVRDIVAHHELMGYLVRRELKSRYKDSALGFVWSLIRPLAMLLIYYIALGQFLGAARSIPDFAIFIYTGLTAWTLFAEIVTVGTASIVANSGLIKKVYLPREVFPLSVVGSAIFNFVIQVGILMAATVAVGRFPTGSRWLFFPLSVAVLFVFSTALALLFSAVNVYLRDVGYLVEVALMILFWASPVVYSFALVHKQLSCTPVMTAAACTTHQTLEQLYLANPVTLVVIGFQQTFWVAGSDQPIPDQLAGRLWIMLVISVILLWVCQRTFARLQANFAQEL